MDILNEQEDDKNKKKNIPQDFDIMPTDKFLNELQKKSEEFSKNYIREGELDLRKWGGDN